MAIRFSGKFSDATMNAFISVLVQKGWDYVEEWFKSQGVKPEVGNFDLNRQLDKPFNQIDKKGNVYFWFHIDRNKNSYLCYVLNPSDQHWTNIDFKTGMNLYLN